jgi:hypothetical protein
MREAIEARLASLRGSVPRAKRSFATKSRRLNFRRHSVFEELLSSPAIDAGNAVHRWSRRRQHARQISEGVDLEAGRVEGWLGS